MHDKFRDYPGGPERPRLSRVQGMTPTFMRLANSTGTYDRDQDEAAVVAQLRDHPRRTAGEWDAGGGLEDWPEAAFITGRAHVGLGQTCECGLCPPPRIS